MVTHAAGVLAEFGHLLRRRPFDRAVTEHGSLATARELGAYAVGIASPRSRRKHLSFFDDPSTVVASNTAASPKR